MPLRPTKSKCLLFCRNKLESVISASAIHHPSWMQFCISPVEYNTPFTCGCLSVGTVIDFHSSCHLFRQPNSSLVEIISIIPCVHKRHCVESSSSPSGSEALYCWPLHVITTLKMHSLHNALSWGGSMELMMGRNGNVGNSDIHAKSSLQCIQVVDKLACRQFHWHCYQSLHHKQCCSSKRCLCFIRHMETLIHEDVIKERQPMETLTNEDVIKKRQTPAFSILSDEDARRD